MQIGQYVLGVSECASAVLGINAASIPRMRAIMNPSHLT